MGSRPTPALRTFSLSLDGGETTTASRVRENVGALVQDPGHGGPPLTLPHRQSVVLDCRPPSYYDGGEEARWAPWRELVDEEVKFLPAVPGHEAIRQAVTKDLTSSSKFSGSCVLTLQTLPQERELR